MNSPFRILDTNFGRMKAAPEIEALLAGVGKAGGSEGRWEGLAGVKDTRVTNGGRAAELASEKVGINEGTPPVENTHTSSGAT